MTSALRFTGRVSGLALLDGEIRISKSEGVPAVKARPRYFLVPPAVSLRGASARLESSRTLGDGS